MSLTDLILVFYIVFTVKAIPKNLEFNDFITLVFVIFMR